MYVRNASGLVRDRAKLLHIIVILFLVIYISKRNIIRILIRHWTSSKDSGSNVFHTRNICMKTTTSILSNQFITIAYVNAFLYDLVLTLCYFIALKARYNQIVLGSLKFRSCFIKETLWHSKKIYKSYWNEAYLHLWTLFYTV